MSHTLRSLGRLPRAESEGPRRLAVPPSLSGGGPSAGEDPGQVGAPIAKLTLSESGPLGSLARPGGQRIGLVLAAPVPANREDVEPDGRQAQNCEHPVSDSGSPEDHSKEHDKQSDSCSKTQPTVPRQPSVERGQGVLGHIPEKGRGFLNAAEALPPHPAVGSERPVGEVVPPFPLLSAPQWAARRKDPPVWEHAAVSEVRVPYGQRWWTDAIGRYVWSRKGVSEEWRARTARVFRSLAYAPRAGARVRAALYVRVGVRTP